MELNQPGYRIISETQNEIEFYYNIWRFAPRGAGFKRVDGGVFQIDSESKTVIFLFFLSPNFFILASISVGFFAIALDYHVLFLNLLIAVMFFIKKASVKMVADEMMDSIVDLESS